MSELLLQICKTTRCYRSICCGRHPDTGARKTASYQVEFDPAEKDGFDPAHCAAFEPIPRTPKPAGSIFGGRTLP